MTEHFLLGCEHFYDGFSTGVQWKIYKFYILGKVEEYKKK